MKKLPQVGIDKRTRHFSGASEKLQLENRAISLSLPPGYCHLTYRELRHNVMVQRLAITRVCHSHWMRTVAKQGGGKAKQ